MTDGTLQKRSMRIAGPRTLLALEDAFWSALEQIAKASDSSSPTLIGAIDKKPSKKPPAASLASAVRFHMLLSRH